MTRSDGVDQVYHDVGDQHLYNVVQSEDVDEYLGT